MFYSRNKERLLMKISNKELLKIATDSDTDSEALLHIWITSRSVKVRKAVAANPNASAEVLKAAARLYMEEVLTNPGFEVLRLFDDDPWIKRIGDIYENPSKFFSNSRYIAYRTQEMEEFGRAALISPKADGVSISNLICYMPVGSLKRILKSEEIKQRIKSAIVEGYDSNVVM